MSCEIAPLMAKPRPSVYATASRTVRERVDPRGRRAELVSFGQRRRAADGKYGARNMESRDSQHVATFSGLGSSPSRHWTRTSPHGE